MATINSCNTQLVPTASSDVTYPLQPAFAARPAASALNVTGDGTVATIAFATELLDRQGVFSSPTFTAPVTGKYLLTADLFSQQLSASHTSNKINIVTTARSYLGCNVGGPIRDNNNNWGSGWAYTIADMTSGDTATITLTSSGGTKVIDINGSGITTNFSARLVG